MHIFLTSDKLSETSENIKNKNQTGVRLYHSLLTAQPKPLTMTVTANLCINPKLNPSFSPNPHN